MAINFRARVLVLTLTYLLSFVSSANGMSAPPCSKEQREAYSRMPFFDMTLLYLVSSTGLILSNLGLPKAEDDVSSLILTSGGVMYFGALTMGCNDIDMNASEDQEELMRINRKRFLKRALITYSLSTALQAVIYANTESRSVKAWSLATALSPLLGLATYKFRTIVFKPSVAGLSEPVLLASAELEW